MQELRLVAVSEDGTYAVLAVPGRGGRFVLPIDDRLRTVARGQFSRLAQYEIEVENPLRPKEIQDRIRAGETADEIADAAGIPIDRVRRFEGPVLAEREYRAQEAQRSTVRGHTESGPGPRLGEIVVERLADAGAPSDTLAWDSRKRADGNWQVQLQFTLEHRPQLAEWVFDPRRRHVIPGRRPGPAAVPARGGLAAGRLGVARRAERDGDPDRLPAGRAPRRQPAARGRPVRVPHRAGPGPGPRCARRARPAPAHAPWSREAREPGWARETPTVPVPAARPPEPDPRSRSQAGRPARRGRARPARAAHAGRSARARTSTARGRRIAEPAARTAQAADPGRASGRQALGGEHAARRSDRRNSASCSAAGHGPAAGGRPASRLRTGRGHGGCGVRCRGARQRWRGGPGHRLSPAEASERPPGGARGPGPAGPQGRA